MKWRQHPSGDIYAGKSPGVIRIWKSAPQDPDLKGSFVADLEYPIGRIGGFATQQAAKSYAVRETRRMLRKALREITK
jgi:hypothetical protein